MTGNRVGLSVVVPAFNEEQRLGATLDDLTTFLNDRPLDWKSGSWMTGRPTPPRRSSSATPNRDSRVVLQREPHRGKGGAVKAG
jgi:dolichyl-phosphate beta-glucosyltransferase